MFAKLPIARLAIAAGMAVSALALGTASSTPIADVATSGDEAWVTVRTGDLDLSSPAGARVVMTRFEQAAHKVCGPEPSDRLSFGGQYDTCVRETVNRAVGNLGVPTVEAMNDERH
jgi:UrcA family protein